MFKVIQRTNGAKLTTIFPNPALQPEGVSETSAKAYVKATASEVKKLGLRSTKIGDSVVFISKDGKLVSQEVVPVTQAEDDNEPVV